MNETFSQKAPSISNEIAWEVIMDSIQDSKAILIIGGEIFNHNGKNLDVLLREAVGSHAKAYADGLFHFKGGGLILSYSAIKRFYNQSFEHVSKVLDKITQIPFHIIFSATPDDQIRQAFIRQKLPFSYDFYFKRQPAKAMPEITASKPLLYNLFGDLKERNSLVLTYDDLFDYFTSTSEGNSMSSLLKSEIRGANNFIFIGLPFDKWYVRLLLRVLEQHTQESKSLLKYAANQVDTDADIRSFCLDDFNITCVSQSIGDFVDELYHRCAEAELLRGAIALPTLHKKLHDMVVEGHLRFALDDLLDFFKANQPITDDINELTLLKSQLNDIERRTALKLITQANADVEYERIRLAILIFLAHYKTLLT